MSDQSPFDRPPVNTSTPSGPSMPPPMASGDWGPTTPFNPIGPRQSGPGRGKIAAVALAAAALTGGAIFGISKFANADDPTLQEAAATVPSATVPSANGPVVQAGTENVGATPAPSLPDVLDSDVFGSISECIDIDEILGSLGTGDANSNGGGGVTLGSMPALDLTTISESVGDTVTITSADGVTVYTLGEGDGSIAISKSGGEVTVAASGDVTESTSFDFADFQSHMEDMMGELDGVDIDLGDLSDLPAVSLPADFDPDEIQACIENLNLGAEG